VNWVADHASILLALTGIPFTLFLIPTIWSQWKEKASTVTLATSLSNTLGLLAVMVVFIALGYWATVAADICNAALWAVIAFQRVQYGHRTKVFNTVAEIMIRSFDEVQIQSLLHGNAYVEVNRPRDRFSMSARGPAVCPYCGKNGRPDEPGYDEEVGFETCSDCLVEQRALRDA
jgi:hypothetical protein